MYINGICLQLVKADGAVHGRRLELVVGLEVEAGNQVHLYHHGGHAVNFRKTNFKSCEISFCHTTPYSMIA